MARRTVPPGFESGSDVATMSLLGYDPAIYHTGRAPLEAAVQTDSALAARLGLSLQSVSGRWDHERPLSRGHHRRRGAGAPGRNRQGRVRTRALSFTPAVSYRNLLVYRGHEDFDVTTKPPHEMLDEPLRKWLPKGTGATSSTISCIAGGGVRESRDQRRPRETGVNPATQAWLWGQGHPPAMPTFLERFGVKRAAMITGVDLFRGMAVLLGWEVREVPGMTSFHDTDYVGQAANRTAAALDRYDLVFARGVAGRGQSPGGLEDQGAGIEAIDRHVVGPVVEKLKSFPAWAGFWSFRTIRPTSRRENMGMPDPLRDGRHGRKFGWASHSQ